MNKAKREWLRTIVAFTLIAPPATSISRNHAVELALSGVSTHFHPAMAMDASAGFGGSIGYGFGERFSVLLAATSVSTARHYDMVGGSGHIGVEILTVLLEARYLLAEPGRVMQIKGSASAGAAHIATAAQTISLGALGQTVVPGRTETNPAYSAGLVFSRRWDFVTFEVRPSALIIANEAVSNPQYLIAGGISIGL